MKLYRLDGGHLRALKDQGFSLEQKLQRVIEGNLDTVFRLKLVKSEFVVHGSRIDTLAFDDETKSFVIIEYKREKSAGVADQGAFYLALMLDNRAEFVLEYLNRFPDSKLRKQDVDWSQSRVILVSDSFNLYQGWGNKLEGTTHRTLGAKLLESRNLGIEQVRPILGWQRRVWPAEGEQRTGAGGKGSENIRPGLAL